MKRIKVRTEKNRAERSRLRTLKKDVVTATSKEEAATKLSAAVSALDKAAKRNIIHHKKAARLKSRLAKKVNALS